MAKKLIALLKSHGKSPEQLADEARCVWREKADTLVEVLLLEPDKDGYYHTGWGRKTREGLIDTIREVLDADRFLK